MATLDRPKHDFLRGRFPLRSSLLWLLAVLLVTGAASYSHGTRYAITGHGYFPATETAAAQTSASESAATRSASAVQDLAQDCIAGSATREADGCGRPPAPRSEPAPLRTGVVDPPASLHRFLGDAYLFSPDPRGPDLPALTAVQLSISRT